MTIIHRGAPPTPKPPADAGHPRGGGGRRESFPGGFVAPSLAPQTLTTGDARHRPAVFRGSHRRVAVTLCAWLLIVVCVGSGWANAHPHSWVDLHVRVQFNEQGEITALRQHWLMDPFASTLWLDGMSAKMQERDAGSREEFLNKAANKALGRIAKHDYFTRIRHGDKSIEQMEAKNAQLHQVEQRLELTFELVLEEPIDPGKAPLRYAVFDPTYYVEILHAESDSIRLQGGGLHCDLHIEPPSPDPQKVAYAASLGANVQASSKLGQHFAEWAEISCAQ